MLGMKCAGCEARENELQHLRKLVDEQAKHILALSDPAAYGRRFPPQRQATDQPPAPPIPLSLRRHLVAPAPTQQQISEEELRQKFVAPENFQA